MLRDRIDYFRRIFRVYLTSDKGYLSFWHERPAVNENLIPGELGGYYMTFEDKASYLGPKDDDGVILFDYFADIGRQYNPLAVAQYGLAHYNLYLKTKQREHLDVARAQADWLVKNLEENDAGIPVWKHNFRWRYKQYLAPGWYSAHSQGTGISLLGRMYHTTGDERYLYTAKEAFRALDTRIGDGGVKCIDAAGNVWLEEYLVDPPTHILNGFLWGLWGVWDYYLLTNDPRGSGLFGDCIKTLLGNLKRYDTGYWSLYDLSQQSMHMLASPFYQRLHIVQMRIMFLITHNPLFDFYCRRFTLYESRGWNRYRAILYKAIFKLFYF
ncbi:MAG: D-glucuronyl C5-epimerase family protein [Patescibacteria group bacterium]